MWLHGPQEQAAIGPRARTTNPSGCNAALRGRGPLPIWLDKETGIEFLCDGEWRARKHGLQGRHQWRRVHLAMDTAMSGIRAVEFTAGRSGTTGLSDGREQDLAWRRAIGFRCPWPGSEVCPDPRAQAVSCALDQTEAMTMRDKIVVSLPTDEHVVYPM